MMIMMMMTTICLSNYTDIFARLSQRVNGIHPSNFDNDLVRNMNLHASGKIYSKKSTSTFSTLSNNSDCDVTQLTPLTHPVLPPTSNLSPLLHTREKCRSQSCLTAALYYPARFVTGDWLWLILTNDGDAAVSVDSCVTAMTSAMIIAWLMLLLLLLLHLLGCYSAQRIITLSTSLVN